MHSEPADLGRRNKKGPRRGLSHGLQKSSESLQIHRGLLAVAAGLEVEADLLALIEGGQARALDGGDVDECVLAAARRLDEAVTLGGIEEFDDAFGHSGIPWKGAFRSATCRPATFGALKKSMAGRAGPSTARDGSEAYG